MTNESAVCPKCDGMMEEGFILDRGHFNAAAVSEWIEGAPESSFWTGLKTGGREKFQVMTYRCADCGYLESYAHPQQD